MATAAAAARTSRRGPGRCRTTAGVTASTFRLRDVWARLSPTDRREALQLFWKAIRVSPKGKGGTPITFVARGLGHKVGVELPDSPK